MEGLFQYLWEFQSSDESAKVEGIWTQNETRSRLFRSVPGDFYYAEILMCENKQPREKTKRYLVEMVSVHAGTIFIMRQRETP